MTRLLKLALFALVPLLVLLGGLELTLRALDVGDPDRRLSISRGFDPRVRYLRPDPETPGGWMTQIMGGIGRETRVPPKGARRRVLLFGGSNTQGFPQDALAGALNAADPDPGWEVFNLGRAGYGSERVAILLEQAVDVLAPDVVVVYSGHNEFVESGFAMELAERFQQTGARAVLNALSRLHTTTLLADALEPPPPPEELRPEDRRVGDPRFKSLRYEQTLVVFDTYGRNLRRMADAALGAGAKVLLCTVAGNMLDLPMVGTLPRAVSDEDTQEFWKELYAAWWMVPERLRGPYGPPPLRMRVQDWGMAIGNDELEDRNEGLAGYEPPPLRALSGPFADLSATRGPKSRSIDGAHWTDPSRWHPNVRRVLEGMARLFAPGVDDGERRAVEIARDRLDGLLARQPDHPHALFYLALCDLLLGGDRAEVARLLDEAVRYDRAPRRGTPVSNGIVRELVAELDRPDVALLDADALFRERIADGIIGYELMMDTCHIQPGARPAFMRDVGDAVLALARGDG